MTIAELIAHLATFDPSLRVAVDAYEEGFNLVIPKSLKLTTVEPWKADEETERPDWAGELTQVSDDKPGEQILVITRRYSNY